MAIKLVAFDWNGTLFADTQTIVNADNIILKKLRVKPINVKIFRRCFHVPIIQYWKNIGLSDAFLEKNLLIMQNYFSVFYEPLADKTRSRAGAKEILKFLRQNKIGSIIYSNHTTADIDRQLRRLRIEQYIAKVIARDMGDHSLMHSRGKQQKLEDYIRKHKFKPHEVISVGDTEEEVEIGKHLGYHTVAITGGYNTTARLKKHHPDFLIHNMLELKKIIKKLNKI